MRIAIAFRGGFSLPNERHNGLANTGSGYQTRDALAKCLQSFKKHILACNHQHDIDIFIHSWALEIEKDFVSFLKPKKWLFENNEIYLDYLTSLENTSRLLKKKNYTRFFSKRKIINDDFNGLSHALSLEKVSRLIIENESAGSKYDAVFFYRPDLILVKDISFNDYQFDAISLNGMEKLKGDFHFFVPRKFGHVFLGLLDSVAKGNYHETHEWIRRYFMNHLNINVVCDSILPGVHQDVYRKAPKEWIKNLG